MTDPKLETLRTAETVGFYDIRLRITHRVPRTEVTKSTWLNSRQKQYYFLNWTTPDGRKLAIPTSKARWDLF